MTERSRPVSALANMWSAIRRLPIRELLLAAMLVVAAGLVVHGIALMHEPTAFIVAGLLTAAIGAVFLAEVGD